jgi:cytochrome c oxidase subunit II
MTSRLFDLMLAQVVDLPEAEKHADGAHYFFPEQASEFASRIDNLYMAIFWISTVFFAVIVGLMCYFVVKYRRQPGVRPLPSSSHNTTIEILWSVLPSIILVWIFYEGAAGYFAMRIIPEGAEEIQVEASQFAWTFTYPNGDTTDSLHLVQNRPVKLILRSRDVLHSFYIAAFRQKMDVVPGRYTTAYIVPTRVGKYRVACTEYCGDGHSIMRTYCQVHATEGARLTNTEWKKELHPPSINGQRIFKIYCAGCHNLNGTASTGPALNLIWGKNEEFTDGSSTLVDENYIRDSIYDPNKQIVKGYEPKMPTFKGKLTDKDIDHLIAFIKLKDGMATLTEATATDKPEGATPPASTPADPTTNPPAALPETKTGDADGK